MDYITVLFATLLVLEGIIFSYLCRRRLNRIESTTSRAGNEEMTASLLREIAKVEQVLARIEEGLTRASVSLEQKRRTTTESELEILQLIANRAMSAKEISLKLKKNREYISRVLKDLYDKALITREGRPYRYAIDREGRRMLAKRKAEG